MAWHLRVAANCWLPQGATSCGLGKRKPALLLAGWRLSVPPKRIAMPADDLLITASDDLLLRTWTLAIPTEPPKDGVATNLPTIQPTRTISGHGRQVTALAVTPGSPRQFLSGSVDGTVRQWNADDGSQIKQWIHGDAVSSIGVGHDGGRFVSVGADRTAKVWNVSEENPLATLQGDFRQTRKVEHLSRVVQVAQANLKDAQDAVETAKKQFTADQEIKGKAVASLDAAKKSLSENTASLNEIKSKHDAGAKNLADLIQKRSQAEAALADVKTRSADSGKSIELITAAVKKIESAEELGPTAAALDKIGQELQTHFQSLEGAAQTALDASTKARDEVQVSQDTLTKQVAETQKASDAATAVFRDCETALARAENSIAGSTRFVEDGSRKVSECEAKLAGQVKRQAEASQLAQDQRPSYSLAAYSSDQRTVALSGRKREVCHL